ncbi:glycosyltransferase family 4 protein [Tabrizicola sp. WMC-M-20]|nr:glycosyltransferase family 4 protein [Tabrizicola sp. WMC-M-20]
MKIAFVIDQFLGVTGGAERALCVIASGLAQRGHAVEIVCADPAEGEPFYPLDPAVRINRVKPPTRRWTFLTRKLLNAIHRFGLSRTWIGSYLAWVIARRPLHRLMGAHLGTSRPDVGIAFMRSAIGLMGYGNPPFPRRKIAALRNMPTEELDLGRDTQFLFQRWTGIHAIQHFDWITVQLPEYVGDLPANLQARARVIPNIVPLPFRRVPWEARDSLAVAVSRLVLQKRMDVLIGAWAQVAGRHPDWRLEIYGEGQEAAALRDQIAHLGVQDSVRLMGVTHDIDAVHARARLMVHPAAFEGFPNAVSEALAHGVPVLGYSDCPGLNHLVLDRVNGRLAPASENRVAALADMLKELLADSAQLRGLGANGPQSMAPYSADAIMDLWESLLQEVAETPQAPPS